MIVQLLFFVIISLLSSNKDCEICPLKNGLIHTRATIHPFSGAESSGGINILSNEQFVYAIDSGVVKKILNIDNVLVLIIFNNNTGYVYKGLASTNTNVGDIVGCGKRLGVLGTSIDNNQYLLYFETWEGDKKTNPINYVNCK